MTRDARYFRLATRICAELGAHYIKTYYVEKDFETVTASCPVPIVIAGGKKLPELARGLGQGIREFKGAVDGVKEEMNDAKDKVESDEEKNSE